MSKMLSFYGSSDDNFCYDVNGRGGDEIGCFGKAARFTVTDGEHSVQVYGTYAPDVVIGGVWVVGIALADEGKPLPPWPISFGVYENGYSVMLNIDCPDNVKVMRDGEGENHE